MTMVNNTLLKILIIGFITIVLSIKINAQEDKVLTLSQALQIAEQQSPSLLQSRLSLKQSEESLNAQNASMKSKFGFFLNPFTYSKTKSFQDYNSKWFSSETKSSSGTFTISQPIKWTDGTISLNNNLFWQESSSDQAGNIKNQRFTNNVYIKIDQPLFTYNKTRMELRELELSYENTKLSYAIQLLNIEKSVTQTFYDVYSSQKDLHIAKEEFKNQETNYKIIKNKAEAGLIAMEELFQAELNFSSSKSTLYNKEIALENAKDNFKQILGMDFDENFIILADVSVNPISVNMKNAIGYAIQQRMELRQKDIALEKALFQLVKTKSQNEFRGDLSAKIGIIGDDPKFGNIYDNVQDNQNISISFNIPVFDWGEKKARIRATEASIESTTLSNEEEKKSIILNVRKVCRNLPNLINQIQIARQNEQNSQRTYELNVEKYKNGTITGMDLQQFQNQLTQKKQALTSALIQYKLELLNLKIQTLWDFEKNKSILPVELIK